MGLNYSCGKDEHENTESRDTKFEDVTRHIIASRNVLDTKNIIDFENGSLSDESQSDEEEMQWLLDRISHGMKKNKNHILFEDSQKMWSPGSKRLNSRNVKKLEKAGYSIVQSRLKILITFPPQSSASKMTVQIPLTSSTDKLRGTEDKFPRRESRSSSNFPPRTTVQK